MKLHSSTALIALLSCGQLACGGADQPDVASASSTHDLGPASAGSSVVSAASGSGGAAGHGDLATGASAQPGTFSHIYEVAFRTCRTQCHVMGYSMLNMATRDAAYAALVDQDSNPKNMSCAPLGLKRVQPGAPEQSLLYLKLNINPPCGQQMPPGGLLQQELSDEVRDWIANGAKND